VGVAFEDLVTAKLAFNKALQLGIGMKCDLD
jgi:ornithine cyclodeaminase/alanine dehydrogenase-like protein (mu-crystallin family)